MASYEDDDNAMEDISEASPMVQEPRDSRMQPPLSTRGGRPDVLRKTSKFKPKSNIRRSQADRDAEARAETVRTDALREQAAAKAELAARGRGSRGRGRGRGRGGSDFQGGLSGWKTEGFLGSATYHAPRGDSSFPRTTGSSWGAEGPSTARTSSGTGDRTEKKEKPGITGSTGHGNDAQAQNTTRSTRGRKAISSIRSGKTRVKKEEDEDVLMLDVDEEADEKRIDIDQMKFVNLISSDEDEDISYDQRRISLNPVRPGRKQHVERKVVLETSASSATAGKVRAKSKDTDPTNKGVIINDDDIKPEPSQSKSKGKERAKPSKGKNKVKDETDSLLPQAVADPTHFHADDSTRIDLEIYDDEGPSALLPQKLKSKRIFQPLFSKPILQTAEDHEEWTRSQMDMKAIAEEFGNAGDGEMKDSHRENKVYLFQLPPVMPNLATKGQIGEWKLGEDKEIESNAIATGGESGNATDKGKKKASTSTNTNQQDQNKDVKDEDSPTKDDLPIEKPPPSLTAGYKPSFRGQIGTLTVFASGATSLDWGGIEFELERGVGAMLQEALLIDGSNEHDVKATSMSQVMASFVVKPSWDSLIGGSK